MTPLWQRKPVGIVGLGLIGGSLALDLSREGAKVRALVHRESTAERARQRGLAAEVSTDAVVLQGCGLVVLALPLDQLVNPDPALLAALPPDAVITDVGSVKAPVLESWNDWPCFIGSHPMAGTAHSGVDAGVTGLFAGRPWVGTPGPRSNPKALAAVEELAGAVGSHWQVCGAEEHDRAVALISHLPVMVSAALLQTADRAASAEGLTDLVRLLASSGFADTTRVGGGNPELGALLARCNRDALLSALRLYRERIDHFERLVLNSDWIELRSQLVECRRLRPGFV